MRLDLGLVHARAPRGAAERGIARRAFFIYSEEPDLCLRIKRAGWQVRHLPQMTIVHHAGKGGVRPRMVAQDRLHTQAVCAKAFWPDLSNALPFSMRSTPSHKSNRRWCSTTLCASTAPRRASRSAHACGPYRASIRRATSYGGRPDGNLAKVALREGATTGRPTVHW